MGTSITYTGHPDGAMVFDLDDERISCAATISNLTAQQILDAVKTVEDDPLAMSYEAIGDGEGRTSLGGSETALTVTLYREWRIYSEKVDGSLFQVDGGNVVSETYEADIFITHPGVSCVNQLAVNAVEVRGDAAAIAAEVWGHPTAIATIADVELSRRILDNRLRVNIALQRLELYDDAGVAVIRSWPLSTTGGEPVQTATGVQTERGVPA